MINYSEVVERALNGPPCLERDFELEIFIPNLRSVVAKYGIKYDFPVIPNHIGYFAWPNPIWQICSWF